MNFTKRSVLAVSVAAWILPAAAQTNTSDPAVYEGQFTSEQQKISYAIGAKFGNDVSNLFRRIEVEPDWGAVESAFQARLTGANPKLTDDQVRAILDKFQSGLQEQLSKKHREEGDAFREHFKAQEGVTVTDSGLIIKTDNNGSGPKPTIDDIVTANYRVTLIDGTEVDSTYKRGRPSEFPLKGLVRGWTEALEMMPVGSHWIVCIPPELAYGENGAAPLVGPAATLLFDVELLSCKPAPPPAPADLLKSDIVVVPSEADLKKGAQPKVLNTPEAVTDEFNRQQNALPKK